MSEDLADFCTLVSDTVGRNTKTGGVSVRTLLVEVDTIKQATGRLGEFSYSPGDGTYTLTQYGHQKKYSGSWRSASRPIVQKDVDVLRFMAGVLERDDAQVELFNGVITNDEG